MKTLINRVKSFVLFLSSRLFVVLFSALYAIYNTFSFYPGILYSDSHYRWSMVQFFEKYGWLGKTSMEDHHPVVPSIIMSYIYGITHEVGLFIFIQCFAFSVALFYLSRKIKSGLATNLTVTSVLLLSVNSVYSIFHSFDVVAAIVFAFFVGYLLEFLHGKKSALYALPPLFFMAVAWRLNSFALLPFVVLSIIYLLVKRKYHKVKIALFTITFIAFACAPFIITESIDLRKTNSWVTGIAFEYPKMATKSKNAIHQDFIESLGLSFSSLKNTSYQSERFGNSDFLLKKVKTDSSLSQQLKDHYLLILREEPALFISEKLKFISYKLGIKEDIGNTEIGKWRGEENGTYWSEEFENSYNFKTDPHKEAILDKYFTFSESFNILFQPYLFFLLTGLLTLFLYFFFDTQIAKKLTVVWFTSLLYYSSFFILSSDSIFRYFFPSFFLMQVVFIISFVAVIEKASAMTRQSNSLVLSLLLILTVYFCGNSYLNREKDVIIIRDQQYEILVNEKAITYISKVPRNDSHSFPFFLHVKPQNVADLPLEIQELGFDNLDFSISDFHINEATNRINTTWLMIKIPLPSYQIKSIKTGQYDKEKRIWETEFLILTGD